MHGLRVIYISFSKVNEVPTKGGGFSGFPQMNPSLYSGRTNWKAAADAAAVMLELASGKGSASGLL